MISITLMGKLEHLEHERIHVFIVLILALPLSRESRKCSPLVDGRSPYAADGIPFREVAPEQCRQRPT